MDVECVEISESMEETTLRKIKFLEETIRLREAMKEAALKGEYTLEISLREGKGYEEIARCVEEVASLFITSWFKDQNMDSIHSSLQSYFKELGENFDLGIKIRGERVGNHIVIPDRGRDWLVFEWDLGLNLDKKHDKPLGGIGRDLFKLAFPVALGNKIKQDMNNCYSSLYTAVCLKAAQCLDLLKFSYPPYDDKKNWMIRLMMENGECEFLVPGIDKTIYGFYVYYNSNALLNILFI